FIVALQIPELARGLRSVWKQWAHCGSYRGIYALWKCGEGLDVEQMRRFREDAIRNEPIYSHGSRPVDWFLKLIEEVGKDAAPLRDLVEDIHHRTHVFRVFRLAERALDAIDGKHRK
ncbi:MAG: hypothetical protein AAF517_21830, partial [Planctomycetota bacterium]